MTIEEYARTLLEEVLRSADAADGGAFQEEAFVTAALDLMTEHGDSIAPQLAYHRSPGMKVNAYDLSVDTDDSGDRTGPVDLDLFVADFVNIPELQSLPPAGVVRNFGRLTTFVERVLRGSGPQVDESTTVHELARLMAEAHRMGREVRMRLILLTNRRVGRAVTLPNVRLDGAIVTHQVWDIERLHEAALLASGQVHIDIDLHEDFGTRIPCLISHGPNLDAYLAVVPGSILASVYARYGHRLLEHNVRAFLQARGSVNRAIRKTIAETPSMFLAYNNGIAATATSVGTAADITGSYLTRLLDFQIVNGGQTTASLNDAVRRGVDVSDVRVQMKLTVLRDGASGTAVIPLISRYANSQNKVNLSDLSANEPFHIELERLSRLLFARNFDRGTAATKWYYERARGQYTDERARQRAGAERRKWEAQYPRDQLITKQLAAKYEMSWMQQPWIVSQGSEKNFLSFMAWVVDQKCVPDATYFMHLVAMAIIFRECDRIVREMALGGYKANVVTYTVAWLSSLTSDRFSLDRVWRDQGVSDACQDLMRGLAGEVWSLLSSPPEQHRNVSEWAKREDCWLAILGLSVAIPDLPELSIPIGSTPKFDGVPTAELDVVVPTAPEPWFEVARWGETTGGLSKFDRRFAIQLGAFLTRGGTANERQNFHAGRIWTYAVQNGFRPTANPEEPSDNDS